MNRKTWLLAAAMALACSPALADRLQVTAPDGVSLVNVIPGQPFHAISAASTNATLVASGTHILTSLTLTGLNTTAGYVRLYDSATQPTCSSATGAVHSYLVLGSATAQGGLVVPLPLQGEIYANGLAYCVTGGPTDTDNTSAPASILINGTYK